MHWDLHTCHVRLERELLFVQIDYDALDEELTTDTIVTKERALDKEIIQLIQMACKDPADIARALELTKLLHNVQSIDAAIKIAEFYHLAGLKEKMQIIKADREEKEDRLVTARNKRRRWLKPEAVPREIESVNGRPSRSDPLAEPYPLPNVERPGMARVIVPVIESSQYTKNDTAAHMTQETSLWPDPVSLPESKRKRSPEEESQEDGFVMPPPKQSAFCLAKFACS
jgi:chromosome transmission fidelity protein 4